jgi:hypothetical protein
VKNLLTHPNPAQAQRIDEDYEDGDSFNFRSKVYLKLIHHHRRHVITVCCHPHISSSSKDFVPLPAYFSKATNIMATASRNPAGCGLLQESRQLHNDE